MAVYELHLVIFNVTVQVCQKIILNIDFDASCINILYSL